MCHQLGILYTAGGFDVQPAWFINIYLAYLTAKNNAEVALQKNTNQKK